MTTTGLNLAVTKDGESYNKLRRPDDYLMSTSHNVSPATMASASATPTGKRKGEQDVTPGSKRLKIEKDGAHSTGHKERSRTVESAWDSGMRTMLPGLNGEDQSPDGATSEALAYLHSVRSEASAIPTLLVAPIKPLDDDEPTDHIAASQHVVYEEGVWISVDNGYNTASESYDEDTYSLNPQEGWHKLLLGRFRALRNKLAETSSGDSVPTNSEDVEQTRPFKNKRSWAKTVESCYPSMKELRQMDETTLYLALQGCAVSLRHSYTISHMKSCWLWFLLALVGDFGTLDNERVSRIRDLGSQAGQLGRRLRAGGGSSQDDGHEHAETGGQNAAAHEDEDIEPSETVPRKSHDHHARGESHEDGGSAYGDASGSGAEMVMSENEDGPVDVTEKKDLEEARAHLLAQLGDRLVRSEAASPDILPTEVSAQRPPQLSRAEAERQRQLMREREPRKEATAPTVPGSGEEAEAKPKAVGEATLADTDWNTKATIDMILTVVAECYGQKDLLAFREAW